MIVERPDHPGVMVGAPDDRGATTSTLSDESPLRIEMVTPSMVTAGMEVVIASLVRSLARRGHDVGVTCTMEIGTIGEQLLSEGCRVQLVPAPGLLTNAYPSALAAAFRAQRLDVVHAHSGVWLKSARAAHLAGRVPFVHSVHGMFDDPWYEPGMKRVAARYTDAIIVVSEILRDDLVRRLRIEAPPPVVIVNGIDTERFAPGPYTMTLRRALQLPDSVRLIGHVGRLDAVKNHRMLIDAFARVAPDLPDAHLALIGDGDLRAELAAQAAGTGFGERIHFAGSHADVAPLYRDLDVLVLCSFTEGTSISLLEGMSSGLACIATSVGGNPDVLAHGEAGQLVPSDDAPSLAEALRRCLRAPDIRQHMGHAARARVLQVYSETAMTDAHLAIYRQVVAARRSAGRR